MYIESHAITCPACKGHRYIGHLICLECCGNGRIVFTEQQKPGMFVSGKDLLWFMAKLVFWSAAIAAFVIGWLAL